MKNSKKADPLSGLRNLEYETSSKSLNVLGISTTNINLNFTRPSTSESALQMALDVAKKNLALKPK